MRQTDLAMFSTSADRHRTQKFLLEWLKTWQLGFIFFLFVVLVSSFVFVGFILDPQGTVTLDQSSPSDHDFLKSVYDGDTPVTARFASFNPLNRAIDVTLALENRKFNISTLDAFDITLNLTLFGLSSESSTTPTTTDNDNETILSTEIATISLHCDQNAPLCDQIHLFHEPVVRFPVYRVSVIFSNSTASLFEEGQVGIVHLSLSTTSMLFTLYELVWRNIFLGLGLLTTVAFFSLMIVFSQPSARWPHRWATEQKCMTILLLGVLLLNNPSFILDLFTSFIIFPILDSIFRSTFMALFMFVLLVLTHCAVLPRQHKRPFITFYLPKLSLVCTMWIIGVCTFTWMRINELQNPAYSLFDQSPFSIAIQILFLISLGGYVCYLLILVLMGCYRCCCDPRMPRNHKPFVFRRFTFLWLVTLFVILASIAGVILMIFRPNQSAEYLSFFALYNVYTFCLALVFLPAPIFLSNSVVGEEEDLDRMQLVDLTENDVFALVDDNSEKGAGAGNGEGNDNDIDEYLDDMGDSLRNRLEMMGGTGEDEEMEDHNTPQAPTFPTTTTTTPTSRANNTELQSKQQ